MSSSRLNFTSRELTVMILAGLILVLAPWGWGGVVLWTVAAALGLAVAAFVATFAEARAQRYALVAWLLGLLLGLYGASAEGAAPWSYRWLDYVSFPAAAFFGSSLAALLLSRDLTSRPAAELRRELFRSAPFWAGVTLFAYFAVQDLNAWGVVVDREAFWAKQGLPGIDVGKFDIRPQPYLSWLPSGLNAPFSAADTSQPPMNAWRQMMVLGAPWLLFCALGAGLRRRRGYVLLGWTTVLMACAVGAFGFLNQYSSGTILGYPVPYNSRCFGTFMSRNHAGVYLYLHAAVALALTFWHIRRAGENTLKGGPHLVAAFLAFALALIVALTGSTAGVAAVLAILLAGAPAAAELAGPTIAERLTPADAVPRWRRGLWSLRRATLAGLCVSVAATVAGAPLTLAHFGSASWGGVFANLLLVPLSEIPLVLGMASLLLSVWPPLLPVAAWINGAAATTLDGMTWFAETFAQLPHLNLVGQVSPPASGPLCAAALVACFLAQAESRDPRRLLGLPVAIVALWYCACVR